MHILSNSRWKIRPLNRSSGKWHGIRYHYNQLQLTRSLVMGLLLHNNQEHIKEIYYRRKRDSSQIYRILCRNSQSCVLWDNAVSTQNRILIRSFARKLRRCTIPVATPTSGRSFEVDIMPTELYKVATETMIDILFYIYNKNRTSAFFSKGSVWWSGRTWRKD